MRKILCLAAIVFVAACAASPTDVSDRTAHVGQPSYNGLFGGSGNRSDADSANANTTQTTAATDVTTADSVPARGGLFGGSGN